MYYTVHYKIGYNLGVKHSAPSPIGIEINSNKFLGKCQLKKWKIRAQVSVVKRWLPCFNSEFYLECTSIYLWRLQPYTSLVIRTEVLPFDTLSTHVALRKCWGVWTTVPSSNLGIRENSFSPLDLLERLAQSIKNVWQVDLAVTVQLRWRWKLQNLEWGKWSSRLPEHQ
jgi:hypothetical protein